MGQAAADDTSAKMARERPNYCERHAADRRMEQKPPVDTDVPCVQVSHSGLKRGLSTKFSTACGKLVEFV